MALRKRLCGAGFLAGVSVLLAVLAAVFSLAPGMPGPFELSLLLLLLLAAGGAGAALGYAVGLLIEWVRAKRPPPGDDA